MPNKAKSHKGCKSSLCLLCMRKGDKYFNDFIIARIRKIVKSEINHVDERVPRGICDSCRTTLQKNDAGDMMC